MVDIATVTKRAHDTGFEKGSLATINLVLAYLDKTGPVSAPALLAAWNAGQVAEIASAPEQAPSSPAQEPPPVVSPTDLGPPKMTRAQATSSGFTGNSCNDCGSLQMVRNGTCEKCSNCGATTGCS